MEFGDWLAYGQEKGWVSREFCCAHDVPPYSEEEVAQAKEDEFELLDRCAKAVRLLG